jgi:hypothetical protein
MSSSIVLALVFGTPGTREMLVMAAALGLFLALALWRPARRRQTIVLVDGDASVGGARRPRPLGLLSGRQRRSRAQEGRPAVEAVVGDAPAAGSGERAGVPVIGYVTVSGRASADDLTRQAEVIERACEQRGLVLLEMVREPCGNVVHARPGLCEARPGLRYALGRIAAGDAQGLVVPGLRRLTRSTAELGPIVQWFSRRDARLVAVAQGLDTGEREGRLAARLLIEVSRWERELLGDRALSPPPPRSAGTHDVDNGGGEDLGDVAVVGGSS